MRDFGEIDVRHRRIKSLPIGPTAFTHGRLELCVTIGADARLAGRRDVRRYHDAKGCLDRPAAGERPMPIGIVVTSRAIPGNREVTAAFDLGKILCDATALGGDRDARQRRTEQRGTEPESMEGLRHGRVARDV